MRNNCNAATEGEDVSRFRTNLFFAGMLFLATMLYWSTVHAARDFPEPAIRGTVTSHQYPQYTIDSTKLRITAGGRIFNENNLIIIPSSLPPGPAEVMYRLDFNGQLSTIWLLTREEAEMHPKSGKSNPAGNAGKR